MKVYLFHTCKKLPPLYHHANSEGQTNHKIKAFTTAPPHDYLLSLIMTVMMVLIMKTMVMKKKKKMMMMRMTVTMTMTMAMRMVALILIC